MASISKVICDLCDSPSPGSSQSQSCVPKHQRAVRTHVPNLSVMQELRRTSVFMMTPRAIAPVERECRPAGGCSMTSVMNSEVLLSKRHRSYCIPRNRATDVRTPWPIRTTCGRRVQRTVRCKCLGRTGLSGRPSRSKHATDETRRTILWKPLETSVHVSTSKDTSCTAASKPSTTHGRSPA